jgi:hypothetical protein
MTNLGLGTRRLVWAVGVVALLGLARQLPPASAAAHYNPSDAAQATRYQRALALGVQAYVYGYRCSTPTACS